MVLIKPRSAVQARHGALTQLAEWSNAPDLRSGSFGSVGSNPTAGIWTYGLMVMTLDFESSNLSSNLGRSYQIVESTTFNFCGRDFKVHVGWLFME